MLVSPFYLISLHSSWVDTIYHIDEMISIFSIRDYIKVSSELITVKVATNSDELARLVCVRILDQFFSILSPFLSEILGCLMTLSWCYICLLRFRHV